MRSMTGCTKDKALEESPRRAAEARRSGPRSSRALSYGLFSRLFQGGFRAAFALVCLLCAVDVARAEPPRVVVVGDSLSAGLGLAGDDAFPSQLGRRLRADGVEVVMVNAAVSGDTTAGGLARLDFALADGADLVILELGANDMLRGTNPEITRANLAKMIEQCQARGARVLLAGMVASGNFGPDYKRAFDAVFPDLAKRHGLPFYRFFLEGVAGDAAMVLPDGLHPSPAGVARIVEGVAPLVEKTLAGLRAVHK